MTLQPNAAARAPTARNPTDELAEALACAVAQLREERIDEAEPAFLAILRRWPDQPDALHFLGVLRHTQGRVDEAVALIQRALAQQPEHATAWNNLGNVLLLAGHGNQAADAYEQAVARGGRSRDALYALSNLGVLHCKLGRLGDSERALRRAIEIDESHGDAWYNLSTTLIKQGRVHDGILAHSKAVALWPEAAQPRQEVIRALLVLDERGRAAKLLREWLACDPTNPVAEHMLAACESSDASGAPDRASDGYVRQVFDGFAASFDAKLEALDYRAPKLVVEALRAAVGAPEGRLDIVDAGCGTGLCGPGLRPFAHHLAGCDLSEGMLRRAHLRKAYDVLHQAELTFYLRTQPGAFDAVVSADTLCYFGTLDGALGAAHECLRPGGWLVFTVEALNDGDTQPHRLHGNGRYAHGEPYLRETLATAGFELRSMRKDRLRMEAGDPVFGLLVVARANAELGGSQETL